MVLRSDDEKNFIAMTTLFPRRSGIRIHHEFAASGESGMDGDKRWGWKVTASRFIGPISISQDPMKFADAMRDALKATGFGKDDSVICSPKGVWIDGDTVARFMGTIHEPPTHEEMDEIERIVASWDHRPHGKPGDVLSEKDRNSMLGHVNSQHPAAMAFVQSLQDSELVRGRAR